MLVTIVPAKPLAIAVFHVVIATANCDNWERRYDGTWQTMVGDTVKTTGHGNIGSVKLGPIAAGGDLAKYLDTNCHAEFDVGEDVGETE